MGISIELKRKRGKFPSCGHITRWLVGRKFDVLSCRCVLEITFNGDRAGKDPRRRISIYCEGDPAIVEGARNRPFATAVEL
jgi:hypothetical protein